MTKIDDILNACINYFYNMYPYAECKIDKYLTKRSDVSISTIIIVFYFKGSEYVLYETFNNKILLDKSEKDNKYPYMIASQMYYDFRRYIKQRLD